MGSGPSAPEMTCFSALPLTAVSTRQCLGATPSSSSRPWKGRPDHGSASSGLTVSLTISIACLAASSQRGQRWQKVAMHATKQTLLLKQVALRSHPEDKAAKQLCAVPAAGVPLPTYQQKPIRLLPLSSWWRALQPGKTKVPRPESTKAARKVCYEPPPKWKGNTQRNKNKPASAVSNAESGLETPKFRKSVFDVTHRTGERRIQLSPFNRNPRTLFDTFRHFSTQLQLLQLFVISEDQRVALWELHGLARDVNMKVADVVSIKEIFDSFDEDKTGTLELEETQMQKEFQNVAMGILSSQLKTTQAENFAMMDSDGSGSLDFQEFLRWYSSRSFSERNIQFAEFAEVLPGMLKLPAGFELPESRVRYFWSEEGCSYSLREFYEHLAVTKSKALTEDTVIGAAIRAQQTPVPGVKAERFSIRSHVAVGKEAWLSLATIFQIRLGPFRFAKQADELVRLIALNMQEIDKNLRDPPNPQSTLASSASELQMATGKDLQIPKASESCLSDEEIAIQFEKEILRHGGYIECNLLYVCNPGLRELLGERKLLQFLKAQPTVFTLGISDGQDIVGTLRLAATEPASTGQTLTASTASGRQAMRELEVAVAEFCAAWVPKTAAHDAPFIPRVARDGRVYKKLQAFVRHCPVSSLKAKTSSDTRDISTGKTSETSETRETWIMELLHLRLFLLDRPLTFVVSDSGNPCNKGLKNCCCHLKVALSKEAAVQLETKADQEAKKRQKQNAESAENPKSFRSLVDVASLRQLFCDGDIFVIDKPNDLSSQILQRVYQKMADEEGRGRQIDCSQLDSEVSGCLLFASVPILSFEATFLAVVHGSLPEAREIAAKLLACNKYADAPILTKYCET
eukprot:s1049_g26.t1